MFKPEIWKTGGGGSRHPNYDKQNGATMLEKSYYEDYDNSFRQYDNDIDINKNSE